MKKQHTQGSVLSAVLGTRWGFWNMSPTGKGGGLQLTHTTFNPLKEAKHNSSLFSDFLPKMTVQTKERPATSTVEKAHNPCFGQVVVMLTVCAPDPVQGNGTLTPVVFLPDRNPSITTRKTSDKPHPRNIPESVKVIETKSEKLSRPGGTKGGMTTKCTVVSWRGPCTEKGHQAKTKKIQIKYGLQLTMYHYNVNANNRGNNAGYMETLNTNFKFFL